MFRTLILSSLAFVGVATAADPLTSDEVDRFLNVAEVISEIDEENDGLNFDLDIDDDNMMEAMDLLVDEDGDIVLFDVITEELLDDEEAGPEFRVALRENGFRDSDDFADVGNRLVAAMIRAEISDSDLDDLRTAIRMADILPGEVREVLSRLEVLMENLEDIPDSDIELAREAEDRLDRMG